MLPSAVPTPAFNPVNVPREVIFGCAAVCIVPVSVAPVILPPAEIDVVAAIVVAFTVAPVKLPLNVPRIVLDAVNVCVLIFVAETRLAAILPAASRCTNVEGDAVTLYCLIPMPELQWY